MRYTILLLCFFFYACGDFETPAQKGLRIQELEKRVMILDTLLFECQKQNRDYQQVILQLLNKK